MYKVKKVLAFLLVAVMLIVTATGCSGKTQQSNTNSGGAKQDDKEKIIAPIKVDAMHMDKAYKPKVWGDDPVSKKLTEKTGVIFNITAPPGEGDEKANIMLVAADYPEVMWMKSGPTMQKYIASGALYSIDELASKYNTPKLIGEYIPNHIADAMRQPDGKLYSIPNFFVDKTRPLQGAGAGINVRDDIYKQLGSPQIKTMEDLYNYLKLVKSKNMTYEGKEVKPLITQFYAYWVGILANQWGSQIATDKYADTDGSVKFFLRNKTVLEAFKWLNKLYLEKLIDPEIYTLKDDQKKEAYAQGKYAVVINNFFGLWDSNAALIAKNPNAFYKMIPTVAGTSGVKPYTQPVNGLGGNPNAVITKKCKDPEKVIKFFDYFMSPEGQTLAFYGAEGETWEKINGKAMLKKGVYEERIKDSVSHSQKTGIRQWEIAMNKAFNWEDDTEAEDRRANRAIAEATAFDATLLASLQIDGTSEGGIAFANINASLTQDMTKIVLADSPDKVEKLWSDLLKNYDRMGLTKTEEGWTKQYKDKIKNVKK